MARLTTRKKTHTVDLTRMAGSLLRTEVLPDNWLRVLFKRLPRLQSFLVQALADFDHRSLRLLCAPSYRYSTTRPVRSIYGLRLLTACSVGNAVSRSLMLAFDCFPNLLYLDLSSTRAANDVVLLGHIASRTVFPALEVLKLRSSGLTDEGLANLARGLGTRVWSLDVRNNRLTDEAVKTLIEYCFLPPDHIAPTSYHREQLDNMSGVGFADDESSVVRHLSTTSVPHLRQHPAGITHLYIADNNLTSSSASDLIRTWRLVALDFGELKEYSTGSVEGQIFDRAFGAWLVREILHTQVTGGARLRYLRIDHRVITGDAALIDMGMDFDSSGCSWPSRSPLFRRGVLVYDKEFPGLGFDTIVLTDLPARSEKGWISKTLIAFLRKCGEMEENSGESPRAMQTPGHFTSILRELRLEVPEEQLDLLEYDRAGLSFLDKVEDDFSFFRPEPAEGTERRRPELPLKDVDAFEGDIVQTLMMFRAQRTWSWSGKLAVVRRPSDNERSDPPRRLERYTLI